MSFVLAFEQEERGGRQFIGSPSQKRITRISASKHYGQEKRITASDSDICRVDGVPARYKDPEGRE